MPFTSVIPGVFQCNDCGAHADTIENIPTTIHAAQTNQLNGNGLTLQQMRKEQSFTVLNVQESKK